VEHTGDVATIETKVIAASSDASRYVIGGAKLYPREVEEFSTPIPNPGCPGYRGPGPKIWRELAWVFRRAGVDAEDIQAFCKGGIAHYKVRAIPDGRGFPYRHRQGAGLPCAS